MEGDRRLMDVGELAKVLRVPKSWVYQQTAAKRIPCVRVGRYCRFDLANVMRWLAAEQTAAKAAQAR